MAELSRHQATEPVVDDFDGSRRDHARCLTNEQVAEMARAYQDEEISMTRLARRYGVNRNTIRLYLVEAGAYEPASRATADRKVLAERSAISRNLKTEIRAAGEEYRC